MLKQSAAVFLSLILLSLAACGGSAGPKNSFHTLTVGLVTDKGGLNDKSFNHLAGLGLLDAERNLSANPQCAPSFVPTCGVLQSHVASDYTTNLTRFAIEHRSIIIAVGFLMEQAIYQIAKQYPKQKFAIVDGQPSKGNTPVNLPNVADLFFKPEQSGYLAGVVAGLLEKKQLDPTAVANGRPNDVIGSIAGANFPAVTAYNCGYQDGAKSVNKNITVYTNFDDGSFQNTANANGIGKLQISKGADILFQVDGGAGLGYLQAAKNAGVWGIGVDADQNYLGSYVITSALKKVDQAVFLTIKRLKAGHFNAGPNYFSLSNHATGIATSDSHHIPAGILSVVSRKEQEIRSGALTIPPDDATDSCKFRSA